MDNNILQKSEIKKDIDFIKQELNALSGGQKEILKTLADHGKTLADHVKTLADHGKTLSDHSEQLAFIYENGATKEELKNLATKDDLKNLATKDELNEVKDSVRRVIDKLLDHDDKLDWLKDNMVTKEEFRKFLDSQDKVTTMLERLDQERIFTNRNVGRHEEKIEFYDIKIEQHETDIRRIKGVLKLADK